MTIIIQDSMVYIYGLRQIIVRNISERTNNGFYLLLAQYGKRGIIIYTVSKQSSASVIAKRTNMPCQPL